jgi:hypothetical protein
MSIEENALVDESITKSVCCYISMFVYSYFILLLVNSRNKNMLHLFIKWKVTRRKRFKMILYF